jgi:hypothetical protein
MPQKHIWLPMIGAIAIVIVLVILGLTITKPTVVPAPDLVRAETKVIQQDDGLSRVDIEYPYVIGVSEEVNNAIQTILENRVQEFKKIVFENEQARIETNKTLPQNYQRPAEPSPGQYWYNLYIRYQSGVIDAKTVSVVFFVDEYSGGAHGNKSFIPFNYDIVNKEQIILADVFSQKSDYLQYISDFTYTDIIRQMKERGIDDPDAEWIKTGTAPIEDNFSSFIINGDNTITIFIPPYQVAAYALGEFDVVMPINATN